jgi:hypothetical protein
MLNRFWQGVQSMLGETPSSAAELVPLPMCDLAVTEPGRVQELLRLIESGHYALSLQSSEGQGLGRAHVFAVTQSQVTLRCSQAMADRPAGRVNAVGSSDRGAVMFTLELVPTRLGDLWRAALPAEILCVQSREHRRVEVVRSLGHQAQLITARPGAVKQVLDLSESGASLDIPEPLQGPLSDGNVVLMLDGMRIQVPRLEVVHSRALPQGGTRAGVRIEGLQGEEARSLRRWLNAAETALITTSH